MRGFSGSHSVACLAAQGVFGASRKRARPDNDQPHYDPMVFGSVFRGHALPVGSPLRDRWQLAEVCPEGAIKRRWRRWELGEGRGGGGGGGGARVGHGRVGAAKGVEACPAWLTASASTEEVVLKLDLGPQPSLSVRVLRSGQVRRPGCWLCCFGFLRATCWSCGLGLPCAAALPSARTLMRARWGGGQTTSRNLPRDHTDWRAFVEISPVHTWQCSVSVTPVAPGSEFEF
jgi:hypothetical protein